MHTLASIPRPVPTFYFRRNWRPRCLAGNKAVIMSNWGLERGGRDRTTAELVVDAVRGQIERGQLRPGQRLPPERELAARLGVSRPSVRAGLRTLATLGIVRTRHGSGS